MNYETLFVNPNGQTARADYIPALLTVLAALLFFAYMVGGRTAEFCMLVLMYPAFVLIARRVRSMGYSAWLVLLPLVLALTGFAIQLGYLSLGETVEGIVLWVAILVSAAYALWGCVGRA